MAEEQPQHVTRAEHRADLVELRLELANTLASLDKRTELIAQDLMSLRREMTDRFEQSDQRATDRAGHRDHQIDSLRQEMQTSRAESRQEMQAFRAEMDRFRQTTTRQLWVMVGVISVAILGGLIKLSFFS